MALLAEGLVPNTTLRNLQVRDNDFDNVGKEKLRSVLLQGNACNALQELDLANDDPDLRAIMALRHEFRTVSAPSVAFCHAVHKCVAHNMEAHVFPSCSLMWTCMTRA